MSSPHHHHNTSAESSTPRRIPTSSSPSSLEAELPVPPVGAMHQASAPASASSSSSSSSPLHTPVADTRPQSPQAAARPTEPPRIPWQGAIPNFFIVGPHGHLLPHFAPPQASANAPSPSPSTPPQAAAAPQSQIPPLGPPVFTANMGFPGVLGLPELGGMFHFFMGMPGINSELRADPAAAAELLRSLPTVDKGLFNRIERVIIAEQDNDMDQEDGTGWKCGICLEGVEEDSKETGVKALPCNHLFHGDCLEPWFTSHYTCPTCRMDLDPLKTLRNNSRSGVNRPAQTGAGRSPLHPYTRPGETASAAPSTNGQNNVQSPPPSMGPEITFIWQMPSPAPVTPTNLPTSPRQPVTPEPTQQSNGAESGTTTQTTIPGTPTQTCDVPLHASPLPMTRSASAPSPTPPAPSNLPTHSGDGDRPQPQRRSHIHIIHHHHHHPHSPHHHHHLRLPGQPPVVPTSPVPHQGQAQAETTSSSAESTAGNADTNGDLNGSGSDIHGPSLQFFINFTNGSAPPFMPPPPPTTTTTTPPPSDQSLQTTVPTGSLPTPQVQVQVPEPIPHPPSPQPIQRQSLDNWVSSRERALGWRCDAPICALAPSDDDDFILSSEGDKDMLSIYSNLQPLSSPDAEKGFEIHACEHRWHRSCLEISQKSAGRPYVNDGEGRVWVRCEKCRKDGWVKDKRRMGSEGEVEKLVAH